MTSELVTITKLRMKPGWQYDLRPHPAGMGGGQFVCRFPNGYGVSVVRVSGFTYGSDQGLFELAVLEYHGDGINDYKLTYDTPITDDVIGWLNIVNAVDLMEKVAELPATAYALAHFVTEGES